MSSTIAETHDSGRVGWLASVFGPGPIVRRHSSFSTEEYKSRLLGCKGTEPMWNLLSVKIEIE